MIISRQSAQQIVNEMQGIVHQHINLMDQDGIIIASTSPERIGTFHDAASRIVREKLPELSVEHDHQYVGALRGINLPIVIEDEYVGVIGMTGDPEQVKDYGRIIKRMTEILMLDIYAKQQRRIDQRIKNRFMEEWLFDASRAQDHHFVQRGQALGIDISLPRRILIAKVIRLGDIDDYSQPIINQIEKSIQHIISEESSDLFFRMPSFLVCLVSQRSDRDMGMLAGRICDAVQGNAQACVAIGIDAEEERGTPIQIRYAKAMKALKACDTSAGSAYSFYDSITFEIFLGEITPQSKQEFIAKVFQNCTPDTLARWIHVLSIFFRVNGSIGQASELLFMHKNTLQQRLNKLAALTGFDPRNLRDAAHFYTAIQFYNDLNELDGH